MFITTTPATQNAGRRALEQIGALLAPLGESVDNVGFVVFRPTDPSASDVPAAATGFAWQGERPLYPCSVVKAFLLIEAIHEIETDRIAAEPDLDRAMHDMIRWSSNTATNYVIDRVSGTTGDTPLTGVDLDDWIARRLQLNAFYTKLGWREFVGCDISQKLSGDRRYGREAQFQRLNGGTYNSLTPLASARLFHALFANELPLTPEGHARAIATFLRDRRSDEAALPGFQIANMLGEAVPAGWPIWSKAGWTPWTGDPQTSYFRHDLLRTIPTDGRPITLSVMTSGKVMSEGYPGTMTEIGRILLEIFS